MNDNENYLPWANFKPYYELNKTEFDKIGKNTCFRVRCKLCAPALKTIGTNRTSSSNLRKHLKCVHPQELKKLDSSGTGRKKRDVYGEPERKYRKLSDVGYLEGAERDLLRQLVDEYQEIVDHRPTDPELIEKKRKAWESLTVAFNETGVGVKRTPDQLRNFWEAMREKRERGDDGSQGTSSNMSTIYQTHNPDVILPHINYSAQNIWDNTMVDGEEHIDSENEIHQPIVIANLKNEDSCSNLEIDLGDKSPMRYSESEIQARMEHKKRSYLLEEKFQEEKITEQRFHSQNLRMEQELRKQMLKDEMEHKRNMMALEISHQRVLNFMEKKMKDEEWNMKKQALLAEERRKEERHKIELSILRSARSEMPVLPGKKMNKYSPLASKARFSDLQHKVMEMPTLKTSRDETPFQPDKGLDIPPKQDGGLEILLQGEQEEFITLNIKEEHPPLQQQEF